MVLDASRAVGARRTSSGRSSCRAARIVSATAQDAAWTGATGACTSLDTNSTELLGFYRTELQPVVAARNQQYVVVSCDLLGSVAYC